jgi:2-aminoadipate transaminase
MDLRVARLHEEAARRPGLIALAGGLPADELMPRAEISAVLGDVARSLDALQYGWPDGNAVLRGWIASRLAARGLAIEPARVIVTAGAQQALALAAAELPGAGVRVDAATYPGALDAFASVGRTSGDAGDAGYLVAGVSNPHGHDQIEPRRAELLALPGPIVVDEAYAELRFDGEVHRPLALDAPDRVWHVGTVSKTLSPGLRIGWLVPPAAHRDAVIARKQASDLQTCSLAQVALARLLDVIDYDDQLDRARRFYAARAERLSAALRRHTPELRFRDPEGGFSLWIETDEVGDDVALLEAAIAAGVSLDPGRLFRASRASSPVAFRVSFSHAPFDALDEGARRLATALARWRALSVGSARC